MRRQPLYLQALEEIRRDYIDGKPSGFQLPSERKLEDSLAVSSSTIRGALKRLERDGYIERRHGSGSYVLDRQIPDQHVGLLLEVDISSKQLSPYYLKKFQELRMALLKLGIPSRPYFGHLRLGVEIGELTCQEILHELRHNRLSGVISILASKHQSWISELRKCSIPLLGTNRSSDSVVDIDTKKTAASILTHLKARGLSQLAVIGLSEGFASGRGLHREALQLAPEYGFTVRNCVVSIYMDHWQQRAEWQAFKNLWRDPKTKPDCLLLCDDMLFADCQQVLQDAGVGSTGSPEVVVLGSDTVDLSPQIPITRCLRSTHAEAQQLAEAMQQRLQGKTIGSFIEVPTFLLPVHPQAGVRNTAAPELECIK